MTDQRQCVICKQLFDYPPRPGRPPVTCSDKCARIRRNKKSYESRARAEDKGCPPEAHGTSSGYSHYRCSCNDCRRWARTYKSQRREKGIDK